MRSQETMFQMWGSQGRERLWPCRARNADRRCCRDCVQKLRGHWSCPECLERKPYAEFTAWRESRDYSHNGTQPCQLACVLLADRVAAPKHHGSEGRIGPAVGSPWFQTLLSELPTLPALHRPPASLPVFSWRTVSQHQNTMAAKDGSGPRATAPTA